MFAGVGAGVFADLAEAQGAMVSVEHVFEPAKITEPVPGTYVYDMGQNCSQVPVLELKGPAGAQVKAKSKKITADIADWARPRPP